MTATLEYLKSSELVAKIQEFFGIEINTCDNGKAKYRIKNKFWFYYFNISTALGDELFYTSFIPFWFWNIDGAVGRRIVLVWAIVMYIGQGIKDIVQWPRPGPPSVKLQSKWVMEYGMPSTHAMVGMSIPFSAIYYTMHRYQYNIQLCLAIATVWFLSICISRLYLGMHTVLDILAGFALTLLLSPLLPIVDYLDSYLLTNPTSPLLLLVSSILMIVYYPNSGKWTPTRGDTTMILSVTVGVLIGAWANFQTGKMIVSELNPPYPIMWPSPIMLGCFFLRTIFGFVLVFLIRLVSKHLSYNFLCALLKLDAQNVKNSENSLENKHKTIVELGCKYFTCAMIGFNVLYLLPQVFRFLRIERPTFFTEI